MSNTEFDLVIIGSGPAGYVGAIRASQLGLKVAIVEKDKTLGGTCLNVGCIPSKALLESSEHFLQANHSLAEHGVDIGSVKLNLDKLMSRKNKIVDELTAGVDYLMTKNKVEKFNGWGEVLSANEVQVTGKETIVLKAKNIMLATGSIPSNLPGLDYNGTNIISSTEALSLPQVPKELLVIGAGAIGLEMGSVWMRLGSKVTVLEYGDKICGPMDKSTSKRLQQILKKQGMNFITGAKVTKAKASKNSVELTYEKLKDGSEQKISGNIVLVSAGRIPFSDKLGLDKLGIETDKRGFVQVNEHYQTKYPSIYAVGDLIPGPMLAHKAEEEAVAVAEIIAGQSGHVNYLTVPSVIYTDPEVASVGYTEEELKEQGIPYKAGSFPFTANGRAKALGQTDGQVKILAHKETDQILGGHIVGPRAGDLLTEVVVCMEFGGSAEDLARSFHAHPTLSEVVREAALNVDKNARQM